MKLQKKDILNKKISYCKNAAATKTFTCTIEDALKEICSETFKGKVTTIRNSLSVDKQKKLKKELKGYLFSGSFLRRSKNFIQKYSTICVLDFDKVGDAEVAKEEIFSNEYVFSAWISPSGKGVKALIVFDYSSFCIEDDVDYAELHKEAYNQFYEKKFFIPYELDCSGCDVARLCFTSSDANLRIKDEVECFSLKKIEIKKIHKTNRAEKKTSKASKNNESIAIQENRVRNIQQRKNNNNRHVIKSICKYLRKRNLSITSTYFEWYKIGQSLANIFSYTLGKKYYLKLCCLDGQKHDENASIKKLIECYSQRRGVGEHKYGLRTIITAAQEKGWHSREGV
jgi:hypothetical protein